MMDDEDPSSSPGSFHTPDQLPPAPVRTPGTASSAVAASLPATTGRKRPAENTPGDDDEPSPGGGIITRLVSTLTPSRLWKRSRTSLDSYSGSAIRGANLTPHSSGSGGENASVVAKSSGGTKLVKLNLEKKFDDPSSATLGSVDAYSGKASMPVQQSRAIGGQTNAMELPVKKRVRIGDNAVAGNVSASDNAGNRAAAAVSFAAPGGAGKKVRIGGTTSFASSPYHAFARGTPAKPRGSPFDATAGAPAGRSPFAAGAPSGAPNGPTFNVGSAAKPRLRDVRGRAATPAGKALTAERRSTPGASRGTRGGYSIAGAGSTPGRGLAREAGLTRTPGGTIAAGRNLRAAAVPGAGAAGTSNAAFNGALRRRTGAESSLSRGALLSRSTGYRRRPINARSFKPMSRLLTGASARSDTAARPAGGGRGRNGSVMLTESIVSQILAESRNKLGLAGGRGGETALFGGNAAGSGDAAVDAARTFEEEARAYRATNKARAPRVRMNRVLGSGQSGGRRFGVPGESTGTTSATAASGAAAASSMAAWSAAAAPAPAPLFGKPAARPPAAAPGPPPKRMVGFHSPFGAPESDAEMGDPSPLPVAAPFVPYAAATLSPRGDPGAELTPCAPVQENVSREAGEEIERLVGTEEWRREAMGEDYGLGDVSARTPRKACVGLGRRGTPHPRRAAAAEAVSTPALLKKADAVLAGAASATAAPGGAAAPFSFMPGGIAVASRVDTPMAFKYAKSPSGADAAAPSTSEESQTPKPPTASKKSPPEGASTPAPPAGSGWGNIFKPIPGEWKCATCSTKNPKKEIRCLACEAPKPGSGGGGAASPKTDAGGGKTNGVVAGIGAGGFSFGAQPSAALTAATKTFSRSAAARSKDSPGGGGDGKAGIGAGGFSFGGAAKTASPTAAPPSGGIGSGGFSFGGATPAKAKRGRDDGGEGGESGAGIGAGGFSFGASAGKASAPPPSGGGGLAFGLSRPAATPANTPAKAKRGRDEDAPQPAGGLGAALSGGGLNFGAAASAKGESSASAGFALGAGAASSDGKKEDPAGAGLFSFGASGKNAAAAPGAPAFAFGSIAPAAKKDDAAPPSGEPLFGGTPAKPAAAPTPAAAAPLFGAPAFQAPEPSGKTTNGAGSAATVGAPAFSFGATPSKPAQGAGAAPAAPAASFGFTASASQAPSAGSTFTFGGAGGATPAPAIPPAAPGAGFSFGAGTSTPAAPSAGFGAAPVPAPAAGGFGFGNASQPAAAASSTPAAFGFGGAPAPAPAPPAGFGAPAPPTGFGAPAPPAGFGAPAPPAGFGTPAPPAGFGAPAGGFGFGNPGQQPPAAATPAAFGFGGGGTPAPNPTPGFAPAAAAAPGFGGGGAAFGATTPAMGGAAAGGSGNAGNAFSIGTGGPKRTAGGKTPGGRRILKARRPPGTR